MLKDSPGFGPAQTILGTVLFGYDVTKKLLDQRESDVPVEDPGRAPVPGSISSDD
ncbi:MAG: hypothetical protein ABEJ58_09080 [Halodesulfurarchaeum sp.]